LRHGTPGGQIVAPHCVDPAARHCPLEQLWPAGQHCEPQTWPLAQHWLSTQRWPLVQHALPHLLATSQQPPPAMRFDCGQHWPVTGSHTVPAPQQTCAPAAPQVFAAGQLRGAGAAGWG
jgi:hypothetical protein